MNTEELLINEIGVEWFNLVEKNYRENKLVYYFENLFRNLDKYNEDNNFPQRNQIFRIFKEIQPKDVKILVLGESPYSEKGFANGIAFSINEDQMKVPYSLKIIKREIELSLYDGLYIDFDYTLQPLIKQGVMLLNSYLTVNKYKGPAFVWETFIELILKSLSLYNPNVVYILMGGEAHKFESRIKYNNYIIKTIHPSLERDNSSFIGCNCFVKANKYLKKNSNKEIIW